MAKIGRNEPCGCGSGLKYKKCCLVRDAEERRARAEELGQHPADGPRKVIQEAVEKAKEAAMAGKQMVGALGVLVLFSTSTGDAWLLEVTENDAVQLTSQRNDIAVVIDENPDTTEIEWSHTFAIQGDKFIVTSYKEKNETEYDAYPVQELAEIIQNIKKALPAEMANLVHPGR